MKDTSEKSLLNRILCSEEDSDVLKQLAELFDKNPSNYGICHILANKLMEKDPKTASKYLMKYLVANPDDVNAWVKFAEICKKMKYYEGVLMGAGVAMWLTNSTLATYYYATALVECGYYSLALKYFAKLKKLYSKDPLLYHNIGVACEKLERYNMACKYYSKAIRLNNNLSESWYGLSRCYREMKMSDKALDAMNCGLKIKEDPRYYNQLALCYIDLRDYQSAEDAIKNAIKHNPEEADYWLLLGYVLLMEERYHEAIDALKKSAELWEWYSSTWYYLGLAYMELNDNYRAELALKRATRIDPDDFYINYYTGLAQKNLGKDHIALKNLLRAAKINPKSYEVWLAVSDILESMGEYEIAELAREKAEKIKENSEESE
ncbi:MAG: tetratricopeptide repeat protein [Candidatus Korarchaeota archaeon]